ncbi:hypothetical protein HJC23_013013 [Cyclotella cryptica]|uniref:Autophagy-related protein 3 n=1 Tax=Cyclotella cryptica TaxID=29204 RepID=A0ABD3QHC1_9STRA|eukprot:CCRYP_005624-RA/>CCRYP_005624-RA protein AED:0.24 eAED:0.24 QI:0/-1/0/1/-1/1/1/0/399
MLALVPSLVRVRLWFESFRTQEINSNAVVEKSPSRINIISSTTTNTPRHQHTSAHPAPVPPMPSLLAPLKSAREYLSPTLKTSAFLTRGVLTPAEFVAAGDELVYKCPTWSWEGGDPSKRKKHLPPEKQFLVTRGVPCRVRASNLENVVGEVENEGCASALLMGEGGGEDDGEWIVSRILSEEEVKRREEEKLVEDFDLLDGEMMEKLELSEKNGGDERPAVAAAVEEDEYADMADFEDDNVMTDEAAAISSPTTATNNNSSDENSNILKVRTYDLSITYDKYYQTPRVYLMGYSDTGSPLTGEEMMQDVIPDYANKTVTMEYHPHVAGVHASIHPCQHGAVMKTIVKNLTKESEGGGRDEKAGPSVEMYLFIFLKFVSSMIPTINYDFTMDVSASTKR